MDAYRREWDAVVIGGGPGGAVAAFHLAQAGRKVLVVEKESFPRYHVGESLTGIAGQCVADLGIEAEMDRRGFPPKTGVKVIGKNAAAEFFVPVLRKTWQVRRSEFDQLLLTRALEAGAQLFRGKVTRVLLEPNDQASDTFQSGARVGGVVCHGENGRPCGVRTRAVVDASGQAGVLSRLGVSGKRAPDLFEKQIAFFTQLRDAERDPGQMGNNTFIFYSKTAHWAWFVPLSPEVVSVGVVVPSATYRSVASSNDQMMRWGLEHINPDLARRTQSRAWLEPVRTSSNYSYRIEPFVGDGWVCVGDAHRFADPIFSFGVSFAMLEGKAAAQAIVRGLDTDELGAELSRFADFSRLGQNAAYDLIRYFWAHPAFFAYQTRGSLRDNFIRLLAGDCFDESELPALTAMRSSLRALGHAE